MGKVWLTRGGSDGEWEEFALENGVTGGGWLNVPDLSQATTYEAVRTLVHEGRPTKGNRTIGNWAGQLYSLRTNISIGDFALMPLKGEGVVAVGVISSDYIYDGSQEPPHRHYRKVDWKKKDVPKTVFGSDLQRSLGTFMTICEIARHEAFDRISTIVSTGIDPFDDSSEAVDGNTAPSVDLIPPNVINDAAISIQELIRTRFPDHDLADLVGEILKARGYIVRISPRGPDGGVDVLAARGDLGFKGPRVAVQVKNALAPSGIQQINELIGAKSNFGADQALFVSWRGYTKDAIDLGRKNWFNLRLWDADDLVREVTEVYHLLDVSIQNKLPLRQIWVSADSLEQDAN